MTVTTMQALERPRAIGAFFQKILSRFGRYCERLVELSSAARASREAALLWELSDDELAKRGLTRDRIVEYAFRNHTFYC